MVKLRFVIGTFLLLFSGIAKSQGYVIDSLIAQAKTISIVDSLDIGRLSAWQKVFNEAKETAPNYRMEEICTTLGDFFFDYGLYEDGIKYYSYIFSTEVDTVNKSNELINIYRKIGQSFSNLGKPDSAFYYYRQIFDEFEFPERLDVLRDLVEIYAANGDHQKSLEYNLLIENLLFQYDAPGRELSKAYNNIGYNYHKLGSYAIGINYFGKALTISPDITDKEQAMILRNLGISHYNLGNYNRSIELLYQASLKMKDKEELAEVKHLLASIHLENDDYFNAVSNFEEAIPLAKKNNKDVLLSEIYAGYSQVYNETHEYDLAFEYFKKYSRLSDSLRFAAQLQQKRILDNQKYIERTEKENRLLKIQQDLQKAQIAQLESTLASESRIQELRLDGLKKDSIQRVNELTLARQVAEIAKANEINNLLEIARQKNLLEIAREKERSDSTERANQQQQIELAQQKIALQESDAKLNEERITNERNAREIEVRKTAQRNTFMFAGLLALLALFMIWAFRNKQKDNQRLTTAYDNLTEAQDQLKAAETKIRGLLRQQVSGAVAEALLKKADPSAVEERFVCVMFLDIRNFTGYCEGRDPAEIITYQNSVFGFMIDIIERHHGVVNQFMGDGFMATFGAPISNGNDSLNAYRAAHEILTSLEAKVKQKEVYPTRVGIGLHAGYVVTGNVGNEERKQFSITGNTVILAARLEQLNKQFGSSLVYSKELYDALPKKERPSINFEPIIVKGRSTPIEVAAL